MDKKIHVMHIVLSLETGGCENGIVNLINHIGSDDFKVSVCCLDCIGELADRIEEGRRHVFLMKRNQRPGVADLAALAGLLRREEVDVVHTHGWATLAFGYLSAKLAGVRHVIHAEHGILDLDKRRRVIAQKVLLRLVEGTVTVSRDLQRRLATRLNVDDDLFHPIINGVDAAKFHPGRSAGSDAIRMGLGVGDKGILIGSVGRLVEVKRFDLLIEVAERLCRASADVHLVIVGDGPLMEPLQGMIDQRGMHDRFHLVGRKEELAEYFPAMDLFVSTSEFEGISNTILEAMSCGVPVVATAVGGTPEIVEHGRNGYLVGSVTGDELFMTLLTLIKDEDLRATVGLRARASVEKHFSLETMVAQYEQLYRGTVCGNARF